MDCLHYTLWARREQITWLTTLSATAEEKIHLFPGYFFDTRMDYNQVRQDSIQREILLSDPAIVMSSHNRMI